MGKRTDIESIMIIGAGPIVIGQACEFDYSGSQACKALKEEGFRIVLVNSNPATIMTDPEMADATYIEPISVGPISEIIKNEKPDAILPTMGGQTALNCALELEANGILEKYGVELIGASTAAIEKAEDRKKFVAAMESIGLESAKSKIATTIDGALVICEELGFPVIIRPSFTLGGSGGGIAYNREEFLDICTRGLETSPSHEVLIEESLLGWKEFEMEVVRDKADNCIIVCAIENLDPMGVHTGDSITVAPSQTLTDKEYQVMRNASVAILREIGVDTGGSNVQFAVNPENGRLIVIEMNPRVSRSSALASKATGFPIAKVAAKLAVGYTLDELANEITDGKTPASFEPTLDYVVTKVPRFTFEKFPQAEDRLTTQMKSVGEVMAIGRTFKESFQKALRGLETGVSGLGWAEPEKGSVPEEDLRREISTPGAHRIWFVAEALRMGLSVEELYTLSKIDRWFLNEISELIKAENSLRRTVEEKGGIKQDTLLELKRMGFSDLRLSQLTNTSEEKIRALRKKYQVNPVYKRVDSCAAEFSTSTAYMYSTYEQECESSPTSREKIMVLGGGPNRIGQGIEFDYCCVQASLAARDSGFESIMVNCNPETVSTDFDISDRLYFESLTMEDVLEIVSVEKPQGVIVQFGGQTPLKLAGGLEKAGVPIIGTSPQSIDLAEDRDQFQRFLKSLDLKQPENRAVRTIEEAIVCADEINYPLMVRPSYILGGRAMQIVYNREDLEKYIREAISLSDRSPILLDRFLEDAIEVDVDAISDGESVYIGGIMEHIEQAGIHSGDSACALPARTLSAHVKRELKDQVVRMALGLKVVGLMNVQFAIKKGEIFVLEVNPRASRTAPFVSKATGVPLAYVAAKCMLGESLTDQGIRALKDPSYFSVKEAVFPFEKFPGVDPLLGPEMKSTGEVMGIGKSFGEAFGKAQQGAGMSLPKKGTVFVSVKDSDKADLVALLGSLGEEYDIIATDGTALYLKQNGIICRRVNKVMQGQPHIVDAIKNGEIALIINTTEGKRSNADSFSIRASALAKKVAYTTTIAGATAAVMALTEMTSTGIRPIQELHEGIFK